MNKLALALVLVPAISGCSSLTPQGPQVRVYQADVAAVDAPAPPLPEGCRPLSGRGPITQQTQERLAGPVPRRAPAEGVGVHAIAVRVRRRRRPGQQVSRPLPCGGVKPARSAA